VTRARDLLTRLEALKAEFGNELRGAGGAEHDLLQDLFVRLARITSRLATEPPASVVVKVEAQQARSVVMDFRDARARRHITVGDPPWRAPSSRDANLVFFSGPSDGRTALRELAASLRVTLNPATYTGDAAASRWSDLRAAGSAIVDVTDLDPQAHYDLGVVMTLGTHVVVLASADTRVPFDVGQNVLTYPPGRVADVLPAALDEALYGAPTVTDPRSSVDGAVAYARGLAGSGTAAAYLAGLPDRGADPIEAHAVLRLLGPMLPDRNLMVLRSRWAGWFPTEERRCFVIMPFREHLAPTWEAVRRAGSDAGVRVERGDLAAGQEIIASIWAEIGRATSVVVDLTGLNPNVCVELGMADTLGKPSLLVMLADSGASVRERIPSLAKRRYHRYARAEDLMPLLARFFAGELAWA
jgi:hypothetical protein